MAIGTYDRAFLYLQGNLAAEAESGTIAYQGDPLPVATIAKQFAGVTPVPQSVKIDSVEFVPVAGAGNLKPVLDSWRGTKKVKLRIQFGGSGLIGTYEGFLGAPSVSYGAADHTKLTYSFMGDAATIQ
jgi:hypothetical protein